MFVDTEWTYDTEPPTREPRRTLPEELPGCSTPATRCHMDHTVACHDHGKTVVINLGPLCARHHLRTKHRAGWHLEQPEPGTFVWTSPAGTTTQSALLRPEPPPPAGTPRLASLAQWKAAPVDAPRPAT